MTEWRFFVSTRFATDHVVLVARDSDVEVSDDAGHSFHRLPLPDSSIVVAAALSSGQVWLAVVRPDPALLWTDLAHLAWTDATTDPAVAHRGVIVPANSDRILYIVPGRGFRCSTDHGASWHPRCPSAST